MKHNHNTSNRVIRNTARTLAAVTALSLAACTPKGDSSPPLESNPSATTAAVPETTTTTISPEALKAQQRAEAKKYAESPERNKPFDEAIAKYGPRVAQAITAGKFGRWDAYNFTTDHYRSRVKDAGWAKL